MRLLVLALLVPLAACGKGGAGNSSDAAGGNGAGNAAPMATPTGPPPKTPVMQVTPAPGEQPKWLRPRSDAGDPKTAPYDNLLSQPVVNASGR